MRFSIYLLIALLTNVYVLSIQLRIADSCSPYREMIAQAVKSAQIRAAAAHNQLMAWNDPSIQHSAKRLFGSSIEDVAVRTRVAHVFRRIAGTNFMNDQAWQPLWNDNIQGRVDDFIIYCDYRRFLQDVSNPQYWYDVNNSVRMNDYQMRTHSASPQQGGVQLYNWQWRDPETSRIIAASQININAWYLRIWCAEWDLIHDPDAAEYETEASWNYPIWLDPNGDARGDQQEADAAVREILSSIQGPWMNFWQVKLDALLLHELSHMMSLHVSPISNTYSMFATVVKLVTLGYTVTDEGRWY